MRKETFTVHGAKVTFTEVIGVFNGDEFETILIHDESDSYYDGDCIVEVGKPFPETDDEAQEICDECANNLCGTTEYFTVENGKYIVND